MMHVSRVLAAATATVILAAASSLAQADNWPSWRGPSQNGISLEKGVPTTWSAEKNVLWRTKLPGPGGSTPAIWEKHIFLTAAVEGELQLICLNTAGEIQWSRALSTGDKAVRGDEGNYASPSPVTDGKHVWALVGTGVLGCWDFAGQEVWKTDLGQRYTKLDIAFGLSSTPVLADGRLFVQMIHGDGNPRTQEARVVALDAATGKEIWARKRITDASNENEHSYASPILYRDSQRQYLITHGADYAIAYDLQSGDEVWRLGGLNPQDDPNKRYHPTLRFVASPAAAEGLVVVPTAKNGPVFCIRGDQEGDLTGQSHQWVRPSNTPDVPSPVILDGLVYLCRENGNLLVLEAKTGAEVYEQRTNRIRHRASPVYADGHLYLTGRDGKVTVVKTGREFEIVAQNDTGESMSASPAISDGTIYLRTFDALWAIGNR